MPEEDLKKLTRFAPDHFGEILGCVELLPVSMTGQFFIWLFQIPEIGEMQDSRHRPVCSFIDKTQISEL